MIEIELNVTDTWYFCLLHIFLCAEFKCNHYTYKFNTLILPNKLNTLLFDIGHHLGKQVIWLSDAIVLSYKCR